MRKNKYLLLAFMMAFAANSSVWSMGEQKAFSVEAELGCLVTSEDGKVTGSDPKDFYTKPEEAKRFVEQTGVDALAIAFGTSHGFYKSTPVLDFDVIKNVRKLVNVPLVMHGGSGVSHEDYIKVIEAGIRKINYYSIRDGRKIADDSKIKLEVGYVVKVLPGEPFNS